MDFAMTKLWTQNRKHLQKNEIKQLNYTKRSLDQQVYSEIST